MDELVRFSPFGGWPVKSKHGCREILHVPITVIKELQRLVGKLVISKAWILMRFEEVMQDIQSRLIGSSDLILSVHWEFF